MARLAKDEMRVRRPMLLGALMSALLGVFALVEVGAAGGPQSTSYVAGSELAEQQFLVCKEAPALPVDNGACFEATPGELLVLRVVDATFDRVPIVVIPDYLGNGCASESCGNTHRTEACGEIFSFALPDDTIGTSVWVFVTPFRPSGDGSICAASAGTIVLESSP